MKTTVTLICSLFAGALSAQSNFYSVYRDNQTISPSHLEVLPWDETQLVEVSATWDNQSGMMLYTLNNGIDESPLVIPGSPAITTDPIFLDDKIVMGATGSSGNEPSYYNGVAKIAFDLNFGPNGSDPEIQKVGDRVFVIGDDGSQDRHLYEFVQSTGFFQQRTWNQNSDVTWVSGVYDNEIYYTEVSLDTVNAEYTYRLMHIVSGVGPMEVRSVVLSEASDFFYRWDTPVEIWGEFFLVENKLSLSGVSDAEVRVTCVSSPSDYEDLVLTMPSGGTREVKSFAWNDLLYAFGVGKDTLFAVQEHIAGNPAQTFQMQQVLPQSTFQDLVVSSNQQLYFVTSDASEMCAIGRFNGSSQTILYNGFHMHPMGVEHNGVIYFQDNHLDYQTGTDSNAVVLLNTQYDICDRVLIDLAPHAPNIRAALIFDGLYTFLYTRADMTTDILQLEGSPMAGLEESGFALSMYPNPVAHGAPLTVESAREGVFFVSGQDGRVVMEGTLSAGTNYLNLSGLSAGSYLLNMENSARRLVIY